MPARSIHRLLLVLVGLTALALLATVVAGSVLLETYRPAEAEPFSQPAAVSSSADWMRAHGWAAGASALLAVATFVVGALAAARASRRAGAAAMAVSVLAGLGAVVALVTRSLVQWEQLAVYAIAVGQDVSGYRIAASADEVRFVIVDGSEVASDDYAVSLLLHLGGPVIGLLATVAALVVLLRRRRVELTASRPAADS